MEDEILNFVYDETPGYRLDVILTEKLTAPSRAHVQKIIESGNVYVNGKIAKANYKLRTSDIIQVQLKAPKPVKLLPEAIPLHVLYEDHDIIVLNKTRGMVVHPAPGNYSGTLVNALLAHCQDLSGINGEIRPGIVHRLDKDTSGVMVAAKNDGAHVNLAEQIKAKTATRKYLAIVHGNIKQDEGQISGAIGRHTADRKKMAIVREGGKEAITNYKVIERFGMYTLVECKLLTGRTHQIRVHMTSIGHPLVGDPKYGTAKSPFHIAGQALHSYTLHFIHPFTKEEMLFRAPLPGDMIKIIKQLQRMHGAVSDEQQISLKIDL